MTTIKRIDGNVLAVQRGIIVHGCNSKGVMGSGIAKSIRDKYPGAFQVYDREFRKQGLFLGGVTYYHHPPTNAGSEIIIANAITQLNYGRDKSVVYVDYDAVSICFETVARMARETGLPVHFPLIGCGLANGEWEAVSSRIEDALGPDIEKTLWIFK